MHSDLLPNESGAALLEATLVLPVLLLLVFCLTDASLYAWTANLAGKAAQLGLRQAVISDPVAVGPGLEPGESAAYWHGLPPGQSCRPPPGGSSPCPAFKVVCDLAGGCRCSGDACRFRLVATRLDAILAAMRTALPSLGAGNLRVTYATNGLGYVQRPMPVPVDVEVSLLGFGYEPVFLGTLFGGALALNASAAGPSESLGAVR